MKIPYVSKSQISKLDDLMVNYFNIPVTKMMEIAGLRLAEFHRLIFKNKKNILICCGKGNNGGDGISAARYLLNLGYNPKIFLITYDIKKDPLEYLKICKILKIPIFSSLSKLKKESSRTNVIYDCLIGYNLNNEPKGKFKDAINIINTSKKPIIACDTPSGVDTDYADIYHPFVKASHILFLSLPKIGCKKLKSKKYVADIGVPNDLYPKINVKKFNYFKDKGILEI